MFQQKVSLHGDDDNAALTSGVVPGTQRHHDRPVRQHIVLDLAQELTSGTRGGVILAGDRGVGKTYIAQRALEQLGNEYFVVSVRGSAASSVLPYGALSVLLNEVDAAHVQNPLLVLRGLTQLLHKRAQGRRVVLFVDNAHALDEMSEMLVAQLSVSGHIRLLAACSALPGVGGDIAGLWKDNLLRHMNLPPLDLSEAHGVLCNSFKGSFSNSAVRSLWSASGGNVLFLLTLAREQVRQGVLIRHADTWLLGKRPIVFSGAVKEIINARMSRLSTGQREVFELLALAGSIPLSILMSVARSEDMDALQEASLIHVSDEYPPMVTIADPVTANTAARVVPSGRSAELRRRLMAALKDADPESVPAYNDVVWALACGERVSGKAAPAAARAANDASEPGVALRFKREIQRANWTPGMAAEALRAHISLNDHESARELMRESKESFSAEGSVEEWIELQFAGVEVDLANAATAENARVRLADLGSRIATQDDLDAQELQKMTLRLGLAEAEVADFEGRHRDVLRVLDDLVTGNGREYHRVIAGLRCAALGTGGNTPEALAMGTEVDSAGNSPLADRWIRQARNRYLQILLVAGEYRQAAAYLARMDVLTEPPARLGGMFEIAPGLVDLLGGSFGEAMPRLEAGVRQLKTHDPDSLVGLATASLAYALALHGDEEAANRMLGQVSEQSSPASWLTLRLTKYFELSARFELGQRREAIQGFLREAKSDEISSADGTALQFLSAAVRSGDVQFLPQLRNLSRRMGGHFATLCARLVDGLEAADSEILLSVCRDAETDGQGVFARDAARCAVATADAAGNRIALRLAQRAQQSLEAKFGGSAEGSHSRATASLTAREYEVANAAAAGISNRIIAQQMHVSIRTIEGHLYQVYAKLHVANRSDLKDVINAK